MNSQTPNEDIPGLSDDDFNLIVKSLMCHSEHTIEVEELVQIFDVAEKIRQITGGIVAISEPTRIFEGLDHLGVGWDSKGEEE